MIFENYPADDEFEETLTSGSQYKPEGNEEGILKEYSFTLDADTLNAGLVFSAEEEPEDTYVPGRSPNAFIATTPSAQSSGK